MNLSADIIPGKSAAGIALLSEIQLLLAAEKPDSFRALVTGNVFTFGPVIVWSSHEDKIIQIGTQKGYLGCTPQGIKVGDTLLEIHKHVGLPYEDEEDVLRVKGIDGLALETTGWKNYCEAGYDPDAVVTCIFAVPQEERTMPSSESSETLDR